MVVFGVTRAPDGATDGEDKKEKNKENKEKKVKKDVPCLTKVIRGPGSSTQGGSDSRRHRDEDSAWPFLPRCEAPGLWSTILQYFVSLRGTIMK